MIARPEDQAARQARSHTELAGLGTSEEVLITVDRDVARCGAGSIELAEAPSRRTRVTDGTHPPGGQRNNYHLKIIY
jgi:hypothetical protein